MLARNRTWIRLVIESRVSQRFCTTGGNVVVSAVSAVYDRATFVSGWAKCAVIDRAYSGKSVTVESPVSSWLLKGELMTERHQNLLKETS